MKKILFCFLFISSSAFAQVVCTYSNDDVAIQAAINAVPIGGTVKIAKGNCDIRNTLVLMGQYGVLVTGDGTTGSLGATNLIWNGPPGGTVFQFNQTRDSALENVSIFSFGNHIGTGVDIDDTVGVGQVSTHNTLRRVRIGTADYGVFIARTSTRNNDLHVFEDVQVDGAGIGYMINHRQSKWHHIIRGSIAQKSIGINNVYGSFHSEGTNFSWNGIDVQLTNPTDVINLTDTQSEGANRFLSDASSSGNGWNVNIKGGRISTSNMTADGNFITYHRRGALNIYGVDFAQGTNRPNFKIQADNDPGAVLNSVGNIFPNNTPYGSYRTLLNSMGNLYIDANGAGQPLPKSNTQP